MNCRHMVAVLFLVVSFNCNAGIKSFLKKMFCCCMQHQQENEFSVTEPGTDESLQFLEAVGVDDLAIRRIQIDGTTEEELRSGNVEIAMLKRVCKALQDEQGDD